MNTTVDRPLKAKPLQRGHFALSMGLLFSLVTSHAFAGDDKGVGPVSEVKLEKIDAKLVKTGAKIFASKCASCHKFEERYVGPALGGVTKRRKPEWIMNMILNPAQMIQEDETAKGLYGEFLIAMTFQNVSKDEARAILEHFRAQDEKADAKK